MGLAKRRIEWTVTTRNEEFVIGYEPETESDLSGIQVPEMLVPFDEFDQIVNHLVAIRDEIKQSIADDAGIATGSQRTALTS